MIRPSFSTNKKLTVVNFFSGPGVGKSTCSAELFSLMKRNKYKVELVHEFAKDLVWESADHMFGEQDYIFAHQHRFIRRLTRHDIDYAIVDSSLLLGLMYLPDDFPVSFATFVLDVFNSYDNINIFLKRNSDIEYVQTGRNENEQQAKAKDVETFEFLMNHNIPVYVVQAGRGAGAECFDIIKQHKKVAVDFDVRVK